MGSLLKYQMKCDDEESCGKMHIILVDPEEPLTPSMCPFCGYTSYEVIESDEKEEE